MPTSSLGFIQLTRNKTAIVDIEDYDKLSAYKWNCNHYGYAVRQKNVNGKKVNVLMHREIKSSPGMLTDHKNGNKLDNRKENLRVCTKSQNEANAPKHKNNKSGYKGVYKHSQMENRWVAEIRKDKKKVHIGTFNNLKEAAKAYNDKAVELFGEFALLNNIKETSSANR